MPRIKEKERVLNGRGIVFTYEDDNIGKYFYRELKEGTKLYRTKLIEDATTLEEAKEKALDVAMEMREDDPHYLSQEAIPKEKASASSTQALTLVQREEKSISRKERLAREERKIEQPKMTVEKALDNWLKGQRK